MRAELAEKRADVRQQRKVRRALGQVDNRSVRRGGRGFGQQVAGIVAMRARLPQYECSGAPAGAQYAGPGEGMVGTGDGGRTGA